MKTVTVATSRAAEELRTIGHRITVEGRDIISGSSLAWLVWHTSNLVSTATDGRYRLALMHEGTEVEPIALKEDTGIETLEIAPDGTPPLPERLKFFLTFDPSVRRCFWFDETHFTEGKGFQLNLVTENEAGYSPFSPDSPAGAYYVGGTYAEAYQTVAAWNAEVGLTRDDTFAIVSSSMAAGRKRR